MEDSGGYPGSKLVLKDDGNIVVYDASDAPVWAYHPIIPEELPTEPIHIATEWQEVSSSQWVRTQGTLYSNGFLTVQLEVHNKAWSGGLRPRGFLVVRDEIARMIWPSDVMISERTFCPRTDPTCESKGWSQPFSMKFPLEVGQHAVGVDCWHFDGPSSDAWRRNTCIGIKAAAEQGDVPDDVRDPILQILRC